MKTIIGSLYNLSTPEVQGVEFLMRRQCSAKRIIFSDLQKGLSWKEGLKRAQSLITDIPSRYIHSAKDLAHGTYKQIQEAQAELNERMEKKSEKKGIKFTPRTLKVTFGTKDLFAERTKGTITNQEWKEARNSELYSEGWKFHLGNLNLRITEVNKQFRLRITTGDRQWITTDLYIPEKHKTALSAHLYNEPKYTVRVKRASNKKRGSQFLVYISFDTSGTEVSTSFAQGVIGLDINPDRIAYTEVNREGNFIGVKEVLINECVSLSHEQTTNYLSNRLEEIINFALVKGKNLVFEDLKFKRDKTYGPRLNRIFSNFAYRKVIDLLISKCSYRGVGWKQVNPAFTSQIGVLKYAKELNLSNHQAASFVIARRGLGFKERISKTLRSPPKAMEARKGLELEVLELLELSSFEGNKIYSNRVPW